MKTIEQVLQEMSEKLGKKIDLSPILYNPNNPSNPTIRYITVDGEITKDQKVIDLYKSLMDN